MSGPGRPKTEPDRELLLRGFAASFTAYALTMLLWRKLGWQHLGLLLLVWACLTRLEAPRRFVREWWPMILFWLSYDVMRLFSGSLFRRVAVEPPYRWESALFTSPDGSIWPFYCTRWIEANGGGLWAALLIHYCNLIYLSQLFFVPVVLLILWVRKSSLFPILLWSFTALHAMALVIYFAYPAAPPWWVLENGLIKPSVERSMPYGLEQGSVLSGLFHLSPNRFAAIPSLHGAYPLLLSLVLCVRRSGAWPAALAFLYTGSMWFACVFLNQHYIIDLLIGAALVVPAMAVAHKIGENNPIP